MVQTRPKLFLGCSAEKLPVAEALQLLLDYAAEVTVWPAVFGPGEGNLASIVDAIEASD